MTRTAITLAAFITASTGLTIASVIPIVPRIPSEVAKRLVPSPGPPAEPEDPGLIADRILQNTKDAADRLKENDTGTDTRQKQDQTLKDIDALLKQAENPPPMGGGGSGDKSDEKQKSQDMGGGGQGGGGTPMGGGGKKGSGQQAKGGGSGTKSGGTSGTKSPSWRERRQQEQQARSGGKEKGMGDPQNLPDPTGSGKRADVQPGGQKEQPGGAGAAAGGNDRGGRAGKSPPTLPVDETIAKQVWGHLPEKLRQQMSQYYKEQFMPKYDDLLRQYYSSLAEREKMPKK
jgi:hypothetical protein